MLKMKKPNNLLDMKQEHFILEFKEIGKNDTSSAGGKGASLGEMTKAGIPVPPGFVIVAAVFEYFLHDAGIHTQIDTILHKVDHRAMHTVEQASEEIKVLIMNGRMPKDTALEILAALKKLNAQYVAVRSSATAEDSSVAAWAGQLESYLNTTQENLLDNVKRCWASLFTPRAIFYRFEQNLHEQHISVAVVVQKMVESEVSGIAFSVHPVTQDYNQLIIEAGLGLGEAIVSGQITPDSYVVEKKGWNIIEKNIASQTKALHRSKKDGNEWKNIFGSEQKLSDSQIVGLSKLVVKIEQHYGFPVDVEWAYASGRFYITQSRPITTLSRKEIIIKTYLESVDWVKFLERRRSCFIYHPYIEAERFYLPKVAGFGYKHHLYKWTGENGTHYRSASELQQSMEHFLHLVKSDISKINEWKKRALTWDQRAKELVIFFNKNKAEVGLQDFQRYYDEFVQILLYTVTIPYLCLSSIDYALAKGESKKRFMKALAVLEPLRAFTTYPQLERSMLDHFWDLLQKKSGIKPDLLDKLTPQEILDYIDRGIFPDKNELQQRKEWCIFWYDASQQKICYEFDRSIVHTLSFLEDVKISGKTIYGTTAFPGKVMEVIRRVDNAKDLQKYKPGEIIVSINSSPDLMPALKTCSAIISDEGGITCHAAIVSRELKKPCIIGTKNATKILKDGDLVEVDANKGTVKILKKNKSR